MGYALPVTPPAINRILFNIVYLINAIAVQEHVTIPHMYVCFFNKTNNNTNKKIVHVYVINPRRACAERVTVV